MVVVAMKADAIKLVAGQLDDFSLTLPRIMCDRNCVQERENQVNYSSNKFIGSGIILPIIRRLVSQNPGVAI